MFKIHVFLILNCLFRLKFKYQAKNARCYASQLWRQAAESCCEVGVTDSVPKTLESFT